MARPRVLSDAVAAEVKRLLACGSSCAEAARAVGVAYHLALSIKTGKGYRNIVPARAPRSAPPPAPVPAPTTLRPAAPAPAFLRPGPAGPTRSFTQIRPRAPRVARPLSEEDHERKLEAEARRYAEEGPPGLCVAVRLSAVLGVEGIEEGDNPITMRRKVAAAAVDFMRRVKDQEWLLDEFELVRRWGMRVRIEMDGSRIGTKVYNAADGQEVCVAALAVVQDFRTMTGEPLATLVITGAGAAPDVILAEVAGLEADVEADEPTARAMFNAIQATPQTALGALEDLIGVVRGLLADGACWGMFTSPDGQAYRGRIARVLERARTAQAAAKAEVAHALVAARGVLAEIAAERSRQVSKGYTAAHDDEHFGAVTDPRPSPLARAAASYALRDPGLWPEGWGPWQARPRRRDFIRAAALLVAEIERMDRARLALDLETFSFKVDAPISPDAFVVVRSEAVDKLGNNAVAFDGGAPVMVPPGTYTREQLEAKVEELRQAARSIEPLTLNMAEPEGKEPGA